MGNMYLAASKSSSGQYTTILVLVVLFGLFYLLIIRPQRNRQRRAQQMQGGVMPGQRVRTTAGIYGTITSVDDPDVELEIAPGVEIRILRRRRSRTPGTTRPVTGTRQRAIQRAGIRSVR